MNDINIARIIYEAVKRVNDEGKKVPETCPKCGSPIGVFVKGEPVFLCTNKECEEFFGVLPFHAEESTLSEVEEFLLYKESCGVLTNDNVEALLNAVKEVIPKD